MKKIVWIYCLLGSFVFNLIFAQELMLESKNINFKLAEGPTWDGEEFLYLTDVKEAKIYKFSVIDKTFTIVLENSGETNGMMFDKDKNLIVCESDSGKIQKRKITGELIETIASRYKKERLNMTNDLCVDAKGGIYFTDPAFKKNIKYQSKNRVYYISPKENKVIALIDDMEIPNGILLSNDGETLYVNDSRSDKLRAYSIKENGLIHKGRTFAVLKMKKGDAVVSGADGMATDTNGNLYVTSKRGVQVFDKNGKALRIIDIPEKSTNCTFGNINNDVLYITAGKNLYSIKLSAKGFRHPFDFER